jgi:Fic family protein
MTAKFSHFDLRIVEPSFSSPLTDVIIELDHLRRKQLGGTTHPKIFFQLKTIFHLFESIGSARIEGNNTTISEYIETKILPSPHGGENIQEIENSEKAMSFIDEIVDESSVINKAFILELHKLTVDGLSKEGDRTPGYLRGNNVSISGSAHKPPDFIQVDGYIEELINFINRDDNHKYDLLKTAIVHHRFSWIHPFNNGNGRVVRLLTYALLIKQGFNVKNGRILNPTAIFCIDRDRYYEILAKADAGTDQGILIWCEYVLSGLFAEITKIDKLADHDFLSQKILLPAIKYCFERGNFSKLENDILKIAVSKLIFQSSDLEKIMPGKIPAERSRVLAKLKNNGLIEPITPKGRKYLISFTNNYLLRGVINALRNEKFIVMQD